MNINPGDTVEYIDAGTVKEGKRIFVIKVTKQGVWDGTKVVLNDKEQTTVYNLNWLTKIKSEKEEVEDLTKSLLGTCNINYKEVESEVIDDISSQILEWHNKKKS